MHAFLNEAHHPDRGYIKARIAWEDWTDLPTIEVSIADCSRIVTLDFEPDSLSKRDRAARIRKLRRLQKLINTFVEKAIETIENAEPRGKGEALSGKNDERRPPLAAVSSL